ncbi:hypothetical protein [Flavobacterium sp. GT3P67]|uniref:hypothetical protein n=1 Tax=Flavobacterium sp. GT3P67 TaxID=2541722 RepID=UPI00104AE716|nr:hypothetical protein [Flavobacterium sp. GT3P67]TDE52735.1 hypothetical protein E0H99_11470 [Flavobacterium sp. GT3P67]
MKTTILKPALMVAVFGFAIFSAFAFKTTKSDAELAVFQGHIQVTPGNCESKEVDCQDVNNGRPCLFGVTQLRKINSGGTACPELLWEIDQ